MIISRLYGGLGNQMFQYAAGAALAKRLNTKLYIDSGWFNEIKGKTNVVQRKYELNFFGIKEKNINKLTTLSFKTKPPTLFIEKTFSYNEQFNHLSGNVILDGYWQSERYFSDQEELIRKLFVFKDALSEKKQIDAKTIESIEDSVSLHVRRGDYVSNPSTTKFHGVMPVEYYKKAIHFIVKKVEDPTFIVISDDTEWCKRNIKFPYPTIFIEHVDGKGHEDMRLMSMCHHHIIANSSFSWWGAWLNASKNKIVVAPNNWFADKKVNTRDVIPKKWNKI